MEAIRLEFQPEIKEKILKFLSSFSSDELKITQEDPDFDENRKKLQERAEKITNGTAEYSTFEELNILLEDTISKYEH
ncbi:hypothetical protein IRZ71_09445 [Flavobacterium sp. ANB]|uniref:hypothetical protein n=1 Tax=unclassified Flavobacterium TaxID=196869 RepID=UPI0012B81AB3|nr:MULTISPECIES: hypothetical protein [unclassified Flavobacterium]MBF4516569.1 hypothetical protein [Flavobacterium sp. ANB]MTD69534.1 hypothetical protein [Flavobacterium sp. LC2016-13]